MLKAQKQILEDLYIWVHIYFKDIKEIKRKKQEGNRNQALIKSAAFIQIKNDKKMTLGESNLLKEQQI